jgi:hypothetical protein
MNRVSFEATPEEMELIRKIVARAIPDAEDRRRLNAMMDLTAVNANGCPMDFQKLLDAKSGDFLHDMIGITNTLNRKTGKLKNCFLPRCAKH